MLPVSSWRMTPRRRERDAVAPQLRGDIQSRPAPRAPSPRRGEVLRECIRRRPGPPILVVVLSAQMVMPSLVGAERCMRCRPTLRAFAVPPRLPVQQRRGRARGQVRFLSCSSTSFRTEVHVKPMPFKLKLDDPLFLMGSCFSEVASLPVPLLVARRRN